MNGGTPFTEPVEVRLMFFLARPKGHFGTGRNADKIRNSAPAVPGVKPDLDKLVRSVLDALTGTVIRDDSQVVGLIASKLYDDQGHPGLMAQVTVLTDAHGPVAQRRSGSPT
jgi:Holliday junction resolvase RusA-like endonuclease